MAGETYIHFYSKWIFKLYLLTKYIAACEKYRLALKYNEHSVKSKDCKKCDFI